MITKERFLNMQALGKSITAGLFLASGLFFVAQDALAQESGAFRAIATVFHEYTTIEHAGAEVFGGPLQGIAIVVESSGGPWVVDAKGRRTCVVFGRRGMDGVELEAPCTITDASGDRWFTISKRNVGDVEEGGGGVGRMELLGSGSLRRSAPGNRHRRRKQRRSMGRGREGPPDVRRVR